MTLFIVGYMASGKTTLGRAYARMAGMQFIDLDFYIEQRFRKPVSRIFAEEGEERFRQIEANMLREAGEFDNTVVSCGGGTPCHRGNMDYMLSKGLTVWLEADIPTTVQRLVKADGKRPLTAGKTAEELPAIITEHLKDRIPFYSQAHLHLDGSRLESKSDILLAAENLRTLIASFLGRG